MFFFHGEAYRKVPITSPQQMTRRLSEEGVSSELYTVAAAGHIGAVLDRAALSRAIEFAARCLKRHGDAAN